MSSPPVVASVDRGGTARNTPSISTACVRCRKKKKRCDQNYPRCRPCEAAQVECYGHVFIASDQVPRNYVQSLEAKVQRLEQRLHGIDAAQGPNAVPESQHGHVPASTQPQRTAPSPENVLLMGLSQSQSQHVEQSNDDTLLRDLTGDSAQEPLTLPNAATAGRMVKEYFQSTSSGMSLLHQQTFEQYLMLIYNVPGPIDLDRHYQTAEMRLAVFFVLHVFAVALLTLQRNGPSIVPTSLADRYHLVGLDALNRAGLPHTVQGVQALLLLAQYHYFHPSDFDTWHSLGSAFRLAIELDLHKEGVSDATDFVTLDTRRRTFWVAYAMDRNIAITFNRPLSLSDGAISTSYPSDFRDKDIPLSRITDPEARTAASKLVSNHLLDFRQIQSEIHTVLNERTFSPLQQVDIQRWQSSMQQRLHLWLDTRPSLDVADSRGVTNLIETFEATMHIGLFHLYRPCLNNPNPTDTQQTAMSQAVISIVKLYKRFFLEQKIRIYWHAVETISSAGLALLHTYASSSHVQSHISRQDFDTAIHTCSSVLWGMIERFPAFQAKRDAFDDRVKEVLGGLQTQQPTPALYRGTGLIDVELVNDGPPVTSTEDATAPSWPSDMIFDGADDLTTNPFGGDTAGSLWDTIAQFDSENVSSWE